MTLIWPCTHAPKYTYATIWLKYYVSMLKHQGIAGDGGMVGVGGLLLMRIKDNDHTLYSWKRGSPNCIQSLKTAVIGVSSKEAS